MSKISLLDCTLRDGGYVNDWRFGEKEIPEIAEKLEASGADMLELGFLEDEPYQPDRTIFNSIDQVKQLIGKKHPGTIYSVMAEVSTPIPVEKIAPADPDGPDLIRVIIWKNKHAADGSLIDMLPESYEYCRRIAKKGYRLCIQPARVSQYSDKEFTAMLRMFSRLDPVAIYVVDSWGIMYTDELMHYVRLADDTLPTSIAIGYHGHNNMMQAFAIAEHLLNEPMERDLIIDASVYGIGRGAGNLNTELIAKYMNRALNRSYRIEPLMEVFDRYLKDVFHRVPWGYSPGFFTTACYNANPNYASFYEQELGLSARQIEELLSAMTPEERVIYKKATAEKYLHALVE